MNPAACGRRLAAVSLFVSAVLRPGLAAEAPAADEIVPLAPLVVTDSRVVESPELNENWLYGTIGNVEIVSSGSRKETEDYARRFYEFHLLFTELFPNWNAVRAGATTLVLCGNYDSFDRLQPAQPADGRKKTVSFFGRDADLGYVVLDLQAEGALLDDTTQLRAASGRTLLGDEEAGFERTEVDRDLQVKREYVRFALAQGTKRAPAWLEEGLAQLLAVAEIEGTTLRFGKLRRTMVGTPVATAGDAGVRQMGSTESVDELAIFFDREGFIPYPEFFRLTADSEDARSIVGGRFGMQALAFVHYGLYGENGKHQKAFTKFIERLGQEEFSEKLFTECFDRTCKQGQRDLRGYLGGSRYRAAVAKDFKVPPTPAVELRTATPTEWLRARADAQRYAGRTADAAATLQTAISHHYADARLYASVGFLQHERGNEAEAQTAFQNAVISKVALPGPYIAAAQARLERADAKATLSKADFVAIMRLVMSARDRMAAPRKELYEVAAATWLRAPATPKNENLGILEEGVLAFPSDAQLVADTAELKLRIGRNEDARQLTELGLRVAKDDATRARFGALATKAAAPAVTR